jgi:hypothetical protein
MPLAQTNRISGATAPAAGIPFRRADYFSDLLTLESMLFPQSCCLIQCHLGSLVKQVVSLLHPRKQDGSFLESSS